MLFRSAGILTGRTAPLPTAAPTPPPAPPAPPATAKKSRLQEALDLLKPAEDEIKKLPAETPVPPGQTTPEDETGGTAKATPATRANAYALNITMGGSRLASQPKKFERIAKNDLPPGEREKKVAPYVSLVDKLYDTNKGRATAFKDTYDEVSRFYSKEPDVRRQAHEYLVAKDMLEKQVTQPA